MEKRYELMVDPTPAGWAYGFPKALPQEAVLRGGMAYDLHVDPKFDLNKWIVEQGYPEEHLAYYRLFAQEVDTKDYIYPGGDCQV